MSRVTADDRVRRMLSIVPWVAARADGVTIDELCERFRLDRKRLIADLNTLAFVGVYPYTPDAQLEVVVEDDRVFVHLPQWFDRPVRLTPDQGLALVAAGQSLLSIPGADETGPLARALAKIAASLDIEMGEAIDVDLGRAEASVMSALRDAIDAHRTVRITYYTYGRDEEGERDVDPYRLYAEQGQWYLTAWCHSAQDERIFRVDRIRAAITLDSTFDAPSEPLSLGVFEPSADDPRVVLELEPAAAWVAEQYPVEQLDELDGGRRRVTLAVSAPVWLDRLLVRLGRDATIVDAPAELRGRTPAVAAKILARYRDDRA